MNYVLYTYETVNGKLVCAVYGPSTDKAVLQQIGESMHTSDPALGFMVLELQAVPV